MIIKYVYPIVWLGLVIFASLAPSDKLPDFQLFKHADKVIHFSIYCGLSLLSVPSFLKVRNYKRSYFYTVIFSVIIGFLMEYLQYTMSNGRSAEISDIIANCMGAFTGIVFYEFLFKNKKIEKLFFRIE
jgi:VanZ family protein